MTRSVRVSHQGGRIVGVDTADAEILAPVSVGKRLALGLVYNGDLVPRMDFFTEQLRKLDTPLIPPRELLASGLEEAAALDLGKTWLGMSAIESALRVSAGVIGANARGYDSLLKAADAVARVRARASDEGILSEASDPAERERICRETNKRVRENVGGNTAAATADWAGDFLGNSRKHQESANAALRAGEAQIAPRRLGGPAATTDSGTNTAPSGRLSNAELNDYFRRHWATQR